MDTTEKDKGSGWSTYRFNNIYIYIHIYIVVPTNKTPMAGSFIKTPDTYKYPTCGVINTKNENNECVHHFTTDHQTKQDNHADRLTV